MGRDKLGVWNYQIYTLLYIKEINNKDLLYSTGNSTQYLVITLMEKNLKKKIYAIICIYTHICTYIHRCHLTVHLKLTHHWKSILSSVQFSCSVVSNSLQPHELQHAQPPFPSSTPRAYSNSGPLSR